MKLKMLFTIGLAVFLVVSVAAQSACSNGVIDIAEECDDGNLVNNDGCSSLCMADIKREVYVALYIGDVDGGVSKDWFFFYDKLIDFFDTNEVKGAFSFFPGTLSEELAFKKTFLKMYKSRYVELIQKDNKGTEYEQTMDILPYDEQVKIIKDGQESLSSWLDKRGLKDVRLPKAYNHLTGKFTESMRKALEERGFVIYFDAYVGDGHDPVPSTDDFDVIQYGVALTRTGQAGRNQQFNSPKEMIEMINNFSREDLNVTEINGTQVVKVWAHQQDFEDAIKENTLNEEKWKGYTDLLLRLKNDKNVKLITPTEIYDLRHGTDFSGGEEVNVTEESDELEDIVDEKNDKQDKDENSVVFNTIEAQVVKDVKKSSGRGHSSYGHAVARIFDEPILETVNVKQGYYDESKISLGKVQAAEDNKGLLYISLGTAIVLVLFVLFFYSIKTRGTFDAE